MSTDVILLRLGSTTMESAIVLEWLAEVGTTVVEGEPLLILETDKVEIDLPAPASGILIHAVNVGDEVEVGGRLGAIGSLDEYAVSRESAEAGEPPAAVPNEVAGGDRVDAVDASMASRSAPSEDHEMLRASPPARKLARELGIDLTLITGTGPRGRIQSSDVIAAHESIEPRAPKTTASDAVRKRIAHRLSESAARVVPVTLTRLVDVDALLTLAARFKEQSDDRGRPPSIEDLFIKAAAEALERHPDMNSSWKEDHLVGNPQIDIGFAVQSPRGLVVPVIRDADRLAIHDIAAERRRLTQLALEGTLTPTDVAPGTFTITNLGHFDVDSFTPTLSSPQVGILGMGRVTESVVPRGRGIAIAATMWLSLTFDHRAVDGAPAAEFLGAVAVLVEDPRGS